MRHLPILLAAVCLSACTTVKVYSVAPPAVQGDGVLVQAGDSLYGIARRNGLTVSEVADANGLQAPYLIHPGQRLRLPGQNAAPATSATTGRTADERTVRSEALADAEPDTSSAVANPASKPAPAKPVATKPTAIASAKPATAKTTTTATASRAKSAPTQWHWPADGALLNVPARSDAVVRALDIAGAAGSPVRAAAAGRVLYSGEGSPGYERLIVLQHDGGWLSIYAHSRRQLVVEGQRVAAGAVIAEMGRVGVKRDMLHFELRHEGELVDPRSVLPKR